MIDTLDLSRCRVLIVDDVKSSIDELVEALQGLYLLSVALDGETALRSIAQNPPDLVLLDVMMPQPDGYEICRRLRADPATRELPIILISALGEPKSKARGFEAGGTDYVTKPYEVVEVRARVRSLLKAKMYQDAVRASLASEVRWLAAIIEASPDAIFSTDPGGIVTSWNPGADNMYGYSGAEALGKHIAFIAPPELADELRGQFERVQQGEVIEDCERKGLRKDGRLIDVSLTLTLLRGADGTIRGVSGVIRDITVRRAAQEALRKSEDQLRQAQKMEALGRLTGGIVHDFNNLLSVVVSYSELVINDLQPSGQALEYLQQIQIAGKRAVDLTRQLLVFSRQQVFEPKILDLNETLAGLNKMLARIVGEDIELTTIPGEAIGLISAAPGSIEQLVMNLVVNARDAMPAGGKLTMETANVMLDADYAWTHLGVTPGPHVMLAVSDTGTGMDRATQARIFEPFFTTKETGKGTGLGLATVFGIVQQCGGTIWVYSEPGHGSTFKIYLPRTSGAFETVHERPAPVTLRGSETILLVEDEDQVRGVALRILRRHGYSVLDARNAGEALLLCEKHKGKIDLLLTDVVMPRVSGPELAQRLSTARPEMKVLCMSGYTDSGIVSNGMLAADVAYLQKPITPATLTRKVREVLEGPGGLIT
jgi:two-component system cell cycle sensor histidine kinase/response regulator CckA